MFATARNSIPWIVSKGYLIPTPPAPASAYLRYVKDAFSKQDN
jgi:hypothetical protein